MIYGIQWASNTKCKLDAVLLILQNPYIYIISLPRGVHYLSLFLQCKVVPFRTVAAIAMGFVHWLNDLGSTLFFRPMDKIHDFHFLYFFDDMGTLLVCTPLRYIHRFAEFLVG